MARPVPRRRGSSDDEPTADKYTSRSRGRSAADDEPEEERRPRRGRGELPETTRRGRTPEPETEEERPIRRSRRAAEPDPEPELPSSLEELEALSDKEYDALLEQFDIPEMEDPNEEMDELLAAILDAGDNEPDPEPEPPRRGRGRAREAEPEEEAPRRGRGRRSEPEEDDEPLARGRGRGRSRDEDDDEPKEQGNRGARRGFQGYKKTREATSSFADDFKLTEDEVLTKFLEDEPYAAYAEHGLFQELHDGQRVWNCLESAPKPVDCPICNTGHSPRSVGLFNIVVMPEDGEPQLKTLKAGPALMKIIEAKSKLKTGPLSKEYYSLSQTPGKNDGPVVYSVEVVRERDLKEDWNEKKFTEKELADFRAKMKDENDVVYPSVKDVKEVARKLRDSD